MIFKKLAISFFTLFIFYSQFLFANQLSDYKQNLYGVELCDKVYETLKNENLHPKTQSLLISGDNVFSYNIILEKESILKQNPIDTKNLLIQICMEDFFVAQQEIIDICKLIKKSKFPFNITVAITYGDKQIVKKSNEIKGSDVFIKSIFENQNSTAILLNFSENKNKIIANGSKLVSPLWLLQTFYYSYKTQKINQNLSSFIISQIYKYSFLIESSILQTFFKNNIQSIELCFDYNAIKLNKVVPIIQYFLNNFEQNMYKGWDQNFLMIKIFNQYYWISETTLVSFIIIFTYFMLLFLFIHYIFHKNVSKKFLFSSRNINHLPFAIILILFFSLNFGNSIFGNLLNILKIKNNFFYSILFIFTFAYIIVFKLYEMTIFFGNSYKEKALDLQAAILSFVNLIIFSLIDISLFPLFFCEFCIFVLCYNYKRKNSKLVFFILSIIVFIPYALTLILNINLHNITNLIIHNSYFSLCIILILTPILILLLRVISYLVKNNNIRYSNIKLILFGILIVFLLFGNLLIQTRTQTETSLSKNNVGIKISDIKDSNIDSKINVSYKDKKLFADTIRTLSVEFSQQPVQCDITISSDYKPILYSNNEYYSTSLTTSSFAIPYYPPKKMTFEYGTNSNKSLITITAIFQKSDYNYIIQTEKISIGQSDE